MKPYHIFAIAILPLFFLACDKDDPRPLSASSGSFTYDTLNACDIGSGSNATLFTFQIQLEQVPTLEIGGVEFDLEWSDGDESDDIFEDDFTLDGSTIEYDWCFRFGSTDWFEVRCTIVDPGGKALSNAVTIRVNKPVGAN